MAMRSEPRLAIRSMLSAANGTTGNLNEETISFYACPPPECHRSFGRCQPGGGIPDYLQMKFYAQDFAARLEALNNRRKLLTDQVLQGALAQIEREPDQRDAPVLVLSHPNWPGGVLGIAASRLVELFQPPGHPHRQSTRRTGARFVPFGGRHSHYFRPG
jgi:single-stranded-DNA-specific exonuclease